MNKKLCFNTEIFHRNAYSNVYKVTVYHKNPKGLTQFIQLKRQLPLTRTKFMYVSELKVTKKSKIKIFLGFLAISK